MNAARGRSAPLPWARAMMWAVQLAVLGWLGWTAAVFFFPLTVFEWKLRIEYWPVIEYVSADVDHGDVSVSVDLRPDASTQDLAGILDALERDMPMKWLGDESYRVSANGVDFCPGADHVEDRLRLREALRASRETLASGWWCSGYALPDSYHGFDEFAADTAVVARALDNTAAAGPILIADGVDWAELSQALPAVIEAVTRVEPIRYADLATDHVTLYVQPTWRLDELNQLATIAAAGKLAVTIDNAYLGDAGGTLRHDLLALPGVTTVGMNNLGATIWCSDATAAAAAARWLAAHYPEQALQWRIVAGGSPTDPEPPIEYVNWEGVPPVGLDRFAQLATLPATSAISWQDYQGDIPVVYFTTERRLDALPVLRDLVGEVTLRYYDDQGWTRIHTGAHVTTDDISDGTLDPAAIAEAWNP